MIGSERAESDCNTVLQYSTRLYYTDSEVTAHYCTERWLHSKTRYVAAQRTVTELTVNVFRWSTVECLIDVYVERRSAVVIAASQKENDDISLVKRERPFLFRCCRDCHPFTHNKITCRVWRIGTSVVLRRTHSNVQQLKCRILLQYGTVLTVHQITVLRWSIPRLFSHLPSFKLNSHVNSPTSPRRRQRTTRVFENSAHKDMTPTNIDRSALDEMYS